MELERTSGAQREEGEECSACRRPGQEPLAKGAGGEQEQKGELEGFRMLGTGLLGLSGGPFSRSPLLGVAFGGQ